MRHNIGHSNPRLNWNNYTIGNMWGASSIISFTLFVGQPGQLFKRSFQLGTYFCSHMDCELQVGYNFVNKKWLYLVSKIVLPYCEKKLSCYLAIKKTLLKFIRGWRRRIWKMFEITRTIYSNSKFRTILGTEYFFNLFLEVYQI